MGAKTGDAMNEPESVDQIRRDMERTRGEMGRTLSELQRRLDPATLKAQAKDAAYDATLGKVGNMAQNAGISIKRSIQENPLPLAIAALGVGWMIVRARSAAAAPPRYEPPSPPVRERIASTAEDVKERAGRVAESAQATVRDVAYQAQASGRRAVGKVEQTFQDNPLAVGLGVVAAGIALGLAFPTTRVEDEWLGEARDKLAEKAQQAAHGALDTMQPHEEQQRPDGAHAELLPH